MKIDRGGKLTWHGPGQLTGYPILKLPEPLDVVAYVRLLEEIIMNVLAQLGIKGERVEGRSGVWILGDGITPDKKIAAIGIRVQSKPQCTGSPLTAAMRPHRSCSSFPAVYGCWRHNNLRAARSYSNPGRYSRDP